MNTDSINNALVDNVWVNHALVNHVLVNPASVDNVLVSNGLVSNELDTWSARKWAPVTQQRIKANSVVKRLMNKKMDKRTKVLTFVVANLIADRMLSDKKSWR